MRSSTPCRTASRPISAGWLTWSAAAIRSSSSPKGRALPTAGSDASTAGPSTWPSSCTSTCCRSTCTVSATCCPSAISCFAAGRCMPRSAGGSPPTIPVTAPTTRPAPRPSAATTSPITPPFAPGARRPTTMRGTCARSTVRRAGGLTGPAAACCGATATSGRLSARCPKRPPFGSTTPRRASSPCSVRWSDRNARSMPWSATRNAGPWLPGALAARKPPPACLRGGCPARCTPLPARRRPAGCGHG